ncbi:MAG: PASTA domain-containing protein [Lentimicrobiaceae bacterium]|nr:PASTA domain-containing protein [Lentimicrobiaceae bacterium]
MKFREFILKKSFYRELLFSVIIIIVLAIIFMFLSGLYTRHNASVITPDLTGLTMDEINLISNIDDFNICVIDSVFDDDNRPGSVISQDPLPLTKVKPNRNVYVILVSHQPEKVLLPELRDLSLRHSLSLLETYGLQVGNIKYVPDIAENAVLDYFIDGVRIKGNEIILKKSVIDLVVGKSMTGINEYLPFMIGMSRHDAIEYLKQNGYYNVSEIFDGTSDSTNAVVYSQMPEFAPNMKITSDVNIILTYKSSKDLNFEEYIEEMKVKYNYFDTETPENTGINNEPY